MGGKSYLKDLESHTFTTSAKFDFCLRPAEETPQESTLLTVAPPPSLGMCSPTEGPQGEPKNTKGSVTRISYVE